MKVAIVGSRRFSNLAAVVSFVGTLPDDTVVVSGGAAGVDSVAENAARACGLQVLSVRPDYDRFGAAAPHIRNCDIVDLADSVVVFWDGKSKGSAEVVRLCASKSKPVEVRADVGADDLVVMVQGTLWS